MERFVCALAFNRIGKADWAKWGEGSGLGGTMVVASVEVVAERIEAVLATDWQGLVADDSEGFLESLRLSILDRARRCDMALRKGEGDV